ncbi:LuxR C-terminal-related transcriptional regulator [Streptomyces sp. TRM76323]|uniref:LuxR C-terminal-related transcriptional regulator n=1 Tax=Streptomyces tamarix TaxID=3078565 RepID=A0ABU3QN85_9ACTN|nr:LuxR C-terminal-related transcriptional regulator [Streptomyces tamarix]MDT9683902.1 LuxR C-terminal-related transcriptional regulator [Streptomyces tamarix]
MTVQPILERPSPVHGRDVELRSVAAALDAPRHGGGGLLVVTADPGLGRTALLDHAVASFAAGPALRVGATPGDSRAPGSGLRALCGALAHHRPTRGAHGDGAPAGVPDADSLAASLRAASASGPLLLCVDDAHLWDEPSRRSLAALLRDARRTGPVAVLVTTVRRHPGSRDFAGLPSVVLGPLSRGAAAAVVDDLATGPVDASVREELVTEAEGNPALLAFLVERLSAAQLAGRAPLPRPLVDAAALTRVVSPGPAELPEEVRESLLLVAAASEDGPDGGTADAALVQDAARHWGLPVSALAAAEAAGLVRWAGGRIGCATAALRRAVYSEAPPARRRAAHGALALAVDADRYPLARLTHTALSVRGPDPRLAAALAAEATRAEARHPHHERSSALVRAAELTAGAGARAERLTAAADQARLAGAPRRARELLAAARAAGGHDAVRGRVELLDGVLTLDDGPVVDAHEALRAAAALLAPYDPGHATAARLAAADAAWVAGDVAACLAFLEAAAEGGAAASPAYRAGSGEEYLAGLRAALRGRLDLARGPLRRTVERAGSGDADPALLLRAGAAALLIGDVAAACRVSARALAAARAAGSAASVPRALEYLAYAELRTGEHARARAHAEEGLRAALRSGQHNVAAHLHAVLALALSVEGDEPGVAAHAAGALDTARRHGLAQAAALAQWASARTDLCRGRVPEAAARLRPVVRSGARGGHFAVRILALPCYVEAMALAGQPDAARTAVEEFAVWASLGADPQAPAQLARCRALLDPAEAGGWYERALHRHDLASGEFERARTLLLYGKWLRRQRRPREAGDRLREALVAFEQCGARGWAEQADSELRAAGSAPRSRPEGGLSRLTAQQLRIARLVAEGATNREVAVRLSLSPRTVDHHLRNVFAVLGVRSRVDLARLVDRAHPAEPAEPGEPTRAHP